LISLDATTNLPTNSFSFTTKGKQKDSEEKSVMKVIVDKIYIFFLPGL